MNSDQSAVNCLHDASVAGYVTRGWAEGFAEGFAEGRAEQTYESMVCTIEIAVEINEDRNQTFKRLRAMGVTNGMAHRLASQRTDLYTWLYSDSTLNTAVPAH